MTSAQTTKAVLTIAGSDSSGGAGIQADLKTMAAYGLFGMSAITALTAQNTTGVYGVEAVFPAFVEQQIDVVFEDIPPDAVKVGMVSSPEVAGAIASALERNAARHVVIDPVMVATSGSALIEDAAVTALVSRLFPLAEVVTPNIPEAQVLAGMCISGGHHMEAAARTIAERFPRPPAVLLKGGHDAGDGTADDFLLLPTGEGVWLSAPRVPTENTHGTGCTLSSAVACGLACGYSVEEACSRAKAYVHGALSAGLSLGRGCGPIDHMWEHRR